MRVLVDVYSTRNDVELKMPVIYEFELTSEVLELLKNADHVAVLAQQRLTGEEFGFYDLSCRVRPSFGKCLFEENCALVSEDDLVNYKSAIDAPSVLVIKFGSHHCFTILGQSDDQPAEWETESMNIDTLEVAYRSGQEEFTDNVREYSYLLEGGDKEC